MTVRSGSGDNAHAYWRLAEPITLDEIERLNRRLAQALGSDTRVVDAARVMRIPGTLNHKHEPPTDAELVNCTDAAYQAAVLTAALPELHASRPRRAKAAALADGPTSRVLSLLDGVTATTNGWKARCPAHDDTNPSLTVSEGDDERCLVHCFAGCTGEQVTAALGMQMSDLFVAPTENADDGHRGQSLAQTLVSIAEDAEVLLFHDAAGNTYARVPTAEHHEVWAVSVLRSGDVERFAHAYHAHGRLTAAPSADAARDTMAADWWCAHEAGERAVMIAHRRSDVADLNRRARTLLHEAGRLGPDVLSTHERAFAVGDRVIATRNDPRLGVVNGQAGSLSAFHDGRLYVELDSGQSVNVPETYVHAGHLDHAYATTAHRAQGATVDRAFILGSDELYREWGYTALSRHRDEARFYVTADAAFLNQAPEPLRDGDAPLRVAQMLSASRAEHLALGSASNADRDSGIGLGL